MSRQVKPTSSLAKATLDQVAGEAALLGVSGLVDERFMGFGDLDAYKVVVINVSGMTRLTSFGVRQWIRAMEALPKTLTNVYLLGCPTFFVDQLNMVLKFGGPAKVLTVLAPYTCTSCGVESGETVDVLAERANLAKGTLVDKECKRCRGKLEFDETPESYFAFVGKYAATSIHPAAAQLLATAGLYVTVDTATEKPPRIIKLVHGAVTYFRIIGTIGTMFRARPFLVGAEGEVVIDLAEVDRVDPASQKEWRRLIKSLASQVPQVTLVDVTESFLAVASDSLALARNIATASVLVPYRCSDCGKQQRESTSLAKSSWPLTFPPRVCATCGGATHSELSSESLAPLQKASTAVVDASAKVIARRDELLSRAVTDANVAQAGEGATAKVGADEMILGKYKIVRPLSSGGMAEVFLANQVGFGGFEKPVAVKRIQRKLLDTRHQAIELFLNEAKIAGRLIHPNIVQVLDVGEVAGALYLAMEYVHGRDLRSIVRKLQQGKTTMPFAEACYVIAEVAKALDHAYWSNGLDGKRLSVVHRDVSPHNVMLGYDGTVKLLDFGVAMSSVTEHAENLIVGKWLYMSPEATTNQPIDHRSDLFSLGVILYLLLSGSMPFSGTEPKQIVKKIRAGQYKPLKELAPSVPDPLVALVSRLLAPNPSDRPQRGQEVTVELTEIARAHGGESSGTQIARLLGQIFPEEPVMPELPKIKEIVRAAEEGAGSMTVKEKSPVSMTPMTGLGPIDVSQTYLPDKVRNRISSSQSIAKTDSGSPVRTSDSIPTQSPSPSPMPMAMSRDAVKLPEKRSGGGAFVVVALLIVVLGVLGGVAYLTWFD